MNTEVKNIKVAAELLKQVMAEFDDMYKNFQAKQGQVPPDQMQQDINQLKKMMNVMSYLQGEIKGQLNYINAHPDPSVKSDKSFLEVRKDLEENLLGKGENPRSIEKRKIDLMKNNIELDITRITPTADSVHNKHLIAQMLNNAISQFSNFKQLEILDAFIMKAEELKLLDKDTITVIKEANEGVIQAIAKDIDIATKMHITDAPPVEIPLNLGEFKFENDAKDPSAPFAKVAKNFIGTTNLLQKFIVDAKDLNGAALRVEQVIMLASQLLQKGEFEAFLAVSLAILVPPIDKITARLELSKNAQDFQIIMGYYAEPYGNYASIVRLQNDAREAGLPYVPSTAKLLGVIDKLKEFLPDVKKKSSELNELQAALLKKREDLENFSGNKKSRSTLIDEIKSDQKRIENLIAQIGAWVNPSLAMIKEYNNLRARMLSELNRTNEKSPLYDLTITNSDPNMSQLINKNVVGIIPPGPKIVRQSSILQAFDGFVTTPATTPFTKKSGLNDLGREANNVEKEKEKKEAVTAKLNETAKKKMEKDKKKLRADSSAALRLSSTGNSSTTGAEGGDKKEKERANVPSGNIGSLSGTSAPESVGRPLNDSLDKSVVSNNVQAADQAAPIVNQQASDAKKQPAPAAAVSDAVPFNAKAASVADAASKIEPIDPSNKAQASVVLGNQALPEIKIDANSAAPIISHAANEGAQLAAGSVAESALPINLSQANQPEKKIQLEPIAPAISTQSQIKPERSMLLQELSTRFTALHKKIMEKQETTPERLANVDEARRIIEEIKLNLNELNSEQYQTLEPNVRTTAEKAINSYQNITKNLVITLKGELAQKLHELAQTRLVGIDEGERTKRIAAARDKLININSDISNILNLDVDNPNVKYYIKEYTNLVAEYGKYLSRSQTRELLIYTDVDRQNFKNMMDKAIEMNKLFIEMIQDPSSVVEKSKRAGELLSEIKQAKSGMPRGLESAAEVVVNISASNYQRILQIQVAQPSSQSNEIPWQIMPSLPGISSSSNSASGPVQSASAILSPSAQAVIPSHAIDSAAAAPSPQVVQNAAQVVLPNSSKPGYAPMGVIYVPIPPVPPADSPVAQSSAPVQNAMATSSQANATVGIQSTSPTKASDSQQGPLASVASTHAPIKTNESTPTKPPVGRMAKLNKFIGNLLHSPVLPEQDSNKLMGSRLGGKTRDAKTPTTVSSPQAQVTSAPTKPISPLKHKERTLSSTEIKAARGREEKEQQARREEDQSLKRIEPK